jgi:uncharacterized protein YjbI with pentapeptide repeats
MATSNNAQQSQPGPIARQLTKIQANGQQPPTKKSKWGLSDKTFWDWLQLLIIPLILAVGGFWFNAQQNQTSLQMSDRQHTSDQAIALEQQHAATLQTYIDNIQDLLLNHDLLKSSSSGLTNPYHDVAVLARARTLTALQGLDGEHKGRLLIFLFEADLIGFHDFDPKVHAPIIDLGGANLNSADLKEAILSGVNLINTNLRGANLNETDLITANLIGTDLRGADLKGADLSSSNPEGANLEDASLEGTNLMGAFLIGANLSGADLKGANLSSADLRGVNLKSVKNLTQQQLDQVRTCKGAILPTGLTCHHNQ